MTTLPTPFPAYNVLLINDHASDARLLQIAWALGNVAQTQLTVLQEGRLLLPYLRREGRYQEAAWPHLILLDQQVPAEGADTLHALRAASHRSLPVVAFMGANTPTHLLERYQQQANCCFYHPASREAFLQLIERVAHFWLRHAVLPLQPVGSTRGNLGIGRGSHTGAGRTALP